MKGDDEALTALAEAIAKILAAYWRQSAEAAGASATNSTPAAPVRRAG
jgi:hypothetical protein